MKLLAVCYALSVICLVDSSSGAGIWKFRRVAEALDRLLDYMKNYAHQMNVDALFGLILGEAETNAAWKYLRRKYPDGDSEAMETMMELKWKFLTARQAIRKALNRNGMTHFNEALLKTVLEPSVWESDVESSISKQLLPVSSYRYSLGNFVERVQSSGTPNETQSDECILEILDSVIVSRRQLGGDDGFIDCFVSNECHYMNVAQPLEASAAYSLTHRLLPLQIMRRLKCRGSNSANFTHLVSKYCNQIYPEFLNIPELNFPPILQDLFLEQMALCGIEGYVQYFDDRFLDPILSWQFPQGCYAVNRNDMTATKKKRSLAERKTRFKRVSEVTEYGCENHTTGLAAAVLALWLKKIILQMADRSSAFE